MSNQDFATAVPPSSQPVQPHHDEKSEAGVAWQPPRLPMAVPAQPMMLAPGYLVSVFCSLFCFLQFSNDQCYFLALPVIQYF